MKSPSQIAADLRSLASKIERSKQPSRVAVSHAIKRVLVAMNDQTNLDMASLSASVEATFESLIDGGFLTESDPSILLEDSPMFDELAGHNIFISLVLSDGKYFASVSCDGDAGMAYGSSPETFDAKAAASGVLKEVQKYLDQG